MNFRDILYMWFKFLAYSVDRGGEFLQNSRSKKNKELIKRLDTKNERG